MKRKLLFLFVALLVASQIAVAYADNTWGHDAPDWDFHNVKGAWDSVSLVESNPINLNVSGDNRGEFSDAWYPAINNFSAFEMAINITKHEAWLGGTHGMSQIFPSFSDYKQTIISLQVARAFVGGFRINVTLYSALSWFGLSSENSLFYGPSTNIKREMPDFMRLSLVRTGNLSATVYWEFDAGGQTTLPNGTTVPFATYAYNSTVDLTSYSYDWEGNPADNFWSSSTVISVDVHHEGRGTSQISLLGNAYVNGALPWVVKYSINANAVLGGVVSWIQGIFDFIGGGWAFFAALIMLVGGFARGFIPLLPFMFMFWAIDAVITSAKSGSIKPIGSFVMTIYDFLIKLWETMIHFGQLIWDAITFWN